MWIELYSIARIVGYVEDVLGDFVEHLNIPSNEMNESIYLIGSNLSFAGLRVCGSLTVCLACYETCLLLQEPVEELQKFGASFTVKHVSSGMIIIPPNNAWIIFIVFFLDGISIDPSGETNLDLTQTDNNLATIILPPELFNMTKTNGSDDLSILFGMYDSAVLFPLPENSMLYTSPNETYETFLVDSTVVAATIIGFEDLTFNDTEVTIVLNLHNPVCMSSLPCALLVFLDENVLAVVCL